MNIKTSSSLLGLLLALSALNTPTVTAANQSSNSLGTINTNQTIDSRLSKLSATIRQREAVIPENSPLSNDLIAAGAWGNGNGRAFANGVNRGFVNGGGGGGAFANGFRNGGGFYNY